MDVASIEQRALGIRLVNIEIRSLVPERETFDPGGWDFFCECGNCRDHVRLPAEDFDRRIAHDELVLAPGHVFAAAAEARRVAHKLREESEALQAQARQAVRRAQQGLRQASVLVVDDSVPFLRAAGSVVSAARQVRWAGSVASGEEAIRAIPRLRPDLVLLDVHMPGISGVETARIIRRRHPEIVIVLISTETAGLAEIARSAGAAALVDKAELTPATLDAIWLKHRLRS